MELVLKRRAHMGERVTAFLIDHLMITFLFVPGILLFLKSGSTGYLILGFLILTAGFLFRDIFSGQSIGKRIMKLAVRDWENPILIPEKERLIIRNLFVLIALIELLAMLNSKDQSRFGDLISSTVVVKLDHDDSGNQVNLEEYHNLIMPRPTGKAKVVRAIFACTASAAMIAVVPIFILSFSMKSMEAYRVTVARIEQSPKVEELIGEVKRYGFIPTSTFNLGDGRREASYEIKVKGEKGVIWIMTYLTKEPDSEWVLHKFVIKGNSF